MQVIQVKPQLEQLLKLPEESLTKESRALQFDEVWRFVALEALPPSDCSTVELRTDEKSAPVDQSL